VVRAVVLVLTLLGLTGCHPAAAPAPSSTAAPATAVLSTVDGATLVRYRLAGGGTGYLQTIDVRTMRIDQVTGPPDGSQPAAPGNYYPGGTSPRLRRISVDRMQESCRARFGVRTFSAVNFSFFEDYESSTQLSFPVKAGGVVVSAGSSPYGPVVGARHPYYRMVSLRVLSWDEHQARIGRYSTATGAPLNAPETRDALVTYLYTDHPAYALDADPADRYQVLGVRGTDHLLIATVVHATLDDAAQLLRRQGVHGDILTFDGGVSTFLWSAGNGTLVSITNKDGALPHYLCVHSGQ
jgi:hypothetical protein